MSHLVIKVGGSLLEDSRFLKRLADYVSTLPARPILVHGGSGAVTDLGSRLGVTPRFEEGLRVTDAATLEVAVLGMVGATSMKLVQHLVLAGVPALGLTGADAGLVSAAPHPNAALGKVGLPQAVSPKLDTLVEAGFVPCLAPICLDQDGELRNLNSDPLAARIAAARRPSKLIYLSNSPVLVGGVPIQKLTPSVSARLVSEGLIDGGMAIKVEAAQQAVRDGVEVLITDIGGLEAGTGTVVSA